MPGRPRRRPRPDDVGWLPEDGSQPRRRITADDVEEINLIKLKWPKCTRKGCPRYRKSSESCPASHVPTPTFIPHDQPTRPIPQEK